MKRWKFDNKKDDDASKFFFKLHNEGYLTLSQYRKIIGRMIVKEARRKHGIKKVS